jgi:hemoglobin/transferrin/lactoferrin receptor protein
MLIFLILFSVLQTGTITPPKSPVEKHGKVKDPKKETTEEIVVIATRKKELKFISKRSTTVVKKKTFDREMPRSTPEALRGHEGIFVQKTNHAGGSPILRGLIGPQVLLTFDGVRLNNSVYRTGPLQYLNLIDRYMIDRIEVVRGPGSVLYGSDAMGGVIGIFPVNPSKRKRTTLYGGELSTQWSSSDNGFMGHGQIKTNIKGLGLLFAGTYGKFGNVIGGGDVGEQVLSGYEQQSFMGSAKYKIKSGFFNRWWFKTLIYYSSIPDAPRTDKLATSNQVYHYDNQSMLAIGKMGFYLGSATKGVFTLSLQNFREIKDSIKYTGYLVDPYYMEKDTTKVLTPGMDLKLVTKLSEQGLTLNYGSMLYHDTIRSSKSVWNPTDLWHNPVETSFPDDSTYTNWGIYMLGEWHAFTKGKSRLNLSGGYRLHGVNSHAPQNGTLNEVNISMSGSVFSAGIQYLYGSKLNSTLTFSQGFRAPNLNELVNLGPNGQFFHIPNPNLKGEYANSFEWINRIKLGSLRLGFSSFFTRITDIIIRVDATHGTEENVVQNINEGKGDIIGAEGSFSLKLPFKIKFFGHLTYTRGDSISKDNIKTPLSKMPPLFGRLSLRWKFKPLSKLTTHLEAYVLGAAKQSRLSDTDLNDVRIPQGGTPGWATINLRGAIFDKGHFIPSTNLRFVVGLENILNTKYKYHASGLYSPGRTITFSLGGKF